MNQILVQLRLCVCACQCQHVNVYAGTCSFSPVHLLVVDDMASIGNSSCYADAISLHYVKCLHGY